MKIGDPFSATKKITSAILQCLRYEEDQQNGSLIIGFLSFSLRAPTSSRSLDRGETKEVPGGERGGAGGTEGGGEEGGTAQGHHRAGEAAPAQGARLQAAGIPAQGRDDLIHEYTLYM